MHHVHDTRPPLLFPRSSPNLCQWLALESPLHSTRGGEILVMMPSVGLETPEAFSLHELSWWPRPLFFLFVDHAPFGILSSLVC
jgi:hypothetical protein